MTLSAQVDYQKEEYGPHSTIDWKALALRTSKKLEEVIESRNKGWAFAAKMVKENKKLRKETTFYRRLAQQQKDTIQIVFNTVTRIKR